MTRVLLRNGVVLGDRPEARATAVAWENGQITFVGDEDAAEAWGGADEVVDLRGALVTAAFTDAHVHVVRTGLTASGLDLAGSISLTACLEALAAHVHRTGGDGVVMGQGWDETHWPEQRHPTADELERAAPGRRVYLTRVDGHSAVVSPALAAVVPGLVDLEGWTPDGRVERAAHHAVRDVLSDLVGPEERLAAARAACVELAGHGFAGFHENAAPHIGPEYELDLVRQAAAETGLRATLYWGELLDVDKARRLGVAGLAGDLVADGAFGSRTAALSAPYADRPGSCGHAYVTADQVREHVVACTEAGLQAGFHAIGDAALGNIHEGLLAAERDLGAERVRAGRHRIEHVEMPSPGLVDTMARLDVTASVQPLFDALWGGSQGMYAARLDDRWRDTNPFRSMARAGVRLALGSDSPVTPLGPWAAVRAAVHHHVGEHGLDPWSAYLAHTRGSADAGVGLPPDRADLVVWDVPGGTAEHRLPDLTPGAPLPEAVRTVVGGRTIHTREEALS
ncbi:amidohydrolase [Nocardioides sp.]|uniref:amidohydrolase n=1 Tax=Nocardioides sp. TaxID=35761 RepID=UPI002ED30308